MNLFNSLKIKNSQKKAKATEADSDCKTSLQTAAAAMNIVDAGVENNDLTVITEQLGNLPVAEKKQAQFAFEAEPRGTELFAIGFGIFFIIVFCILMFLGLNTVILTDLFETLASGMILCSMFALVVDTFIIVVAYKRLSFKRRYNKYFNLLKYHRMEAVDDIAEFTGYKRSLVITDLQKAVKQKYIPEGHFGRNSFLFMVSDEIYNDYQNKPAVYDHYFTSRIEERERMRGHNADTQHILETGKRYIERIHDSNDLIKDKAVSEKLSRMEKTVSMIFKEVDLHPTQSEKLGLFLNYYLPTTEKLLNSYITIAEKGLESKSLSKTLQELTRSLDMINTAFEKILEMLYIEQESDILGDIEAMEAMMSSEGLVT